MFHSSSSRISARGVKYSFDDKNLLGRLSVHQMYGLFAASCLHNDILLAPQSPYVVACQSVAFVAEFWVPSALS